MGVAAALSIGIGVYPDVLYNFLPYEVDYHPYTLEHVSTQLQLLVFSALAFIVLTRTGLYSPVAKSTNLDFDWVYRRLLPRWFRAAVALHDSIRAGLSALVRVPARAVMAGLQRHHGPEGILARTWPTGSMAFWATLLLAAYLVLYYV